MTSGREAAPSKADGCKGRVDSAGEGRIVEIHMFFLSPYYRWGQSSLSESTLPPATLLPAGKGYGRATLSRGCVMSRAKCQEKTGLPSCAPLSTPQGMSH